MGNFSIGNILHYNCAGHKPFFFFAKYFTFKLNLWLLALDFSLNTATTAFLYLNFELWRFSFKAHRRAFVPT